MRFRCRALLVPAVLLLSCPAVAQIPIQGSTAVTFQNPQPPSATTTGVGTNDFTWGLGANGSLPNRLTFTAVPFNTSTGSEFKVGSLAYFNGTVFNNTDATSVDLRTTMNFTTPALGIQNFVFPLQLISTPNNFVDPDADADYVRFPSSFPATGFPIGSTLYTLQLLGFRNVQGDGFLVSNANELHVREQGTASAELWASVTPLTPSSVPEPGLLSWLAGSAFLGVRAALRRALRSRR
jgi:hypothetical protein